ncbi:ABC transporter substrate-binding protein [Blastococcus xanthinilyticus]|uniref:Amino acid/amide ABC transporter substrate-binding protein (HAAT family) n=1 Tax=Blastococcus xanthinilyticus TaxID=1564164 RepID=A0A5S5CQ83_9ACTN|nr:ABC transporter substrate-binding protein [Blastococcus xanthinilyticus]TYP84926.1 amino acid/amide ABC transporter substrate-binding protein (HAAT family) [Blastococcus xanthinilyticus]
MRTGTTARGIAVTGAALLALTACGGGDEGTTPAAEGGGGDGEKQVNVYGTDGNMGNALGESFTEEGALAGMRGTTPLTELGSEFTDRLLEIDPALEDFNYAGETYDAIMISAIASMLAGSTDPAVFAPYINGVTFGGETCETFTDCKAIVDGGGNPDYDGISGPLAFAEAGEPSVASFGILQFGPDNAIASDETDFVLAGDEANAASDEGPAPAAPGATSDDPLVIGTLLPQTGDLAFLGPPEIAGADLAVQEINEAGGVLGQPVQLIQRDSGDTSTDIATQSVDALLQENVDVIVGAASSAVTRTVIDKVTGAGVVQISPANTSDEFTTYNDNGLYFRTAPPDTLQSRALADLIIEDGANTVGILARNDSYGTGLAENTVENLVSSGLAEDSIELVIYDPTAANFDAEVQQMVDLNPDAVVVIGFEESARIIDGLNAEGVGPARN